MLGAEAAASAGAPPPALPPGTHLYPEQEIVVEDESSEDEEGMAADQLRLFTIFFLNLMREKTGWRWGLMMASSLSLLLH